MRLVYLLLAALVAATMAVTQHFALINYWYWTYWWLDLAMHTAGGVVITLIGGALTGVRARIIALTLCVGVLWEVYEFAIGISVAEPNFLFDSLSDLAMDTVGAVVAYGMMQGWEKYRLRLRVVHAESPDQIS